MRNEKAEDLAVKFYRSFRQRTNDVAAFQLLGQLTRGSNGAFFRLPSQVDFAPIESEEFSGAVVTPYAPGRTVADLLADPNIDQDVRTEIEDRYTSAIAWLTNRPIAATARTKDWDPERTWRSGVGATTFGVRWVLKADNVVVDPWTLALTLIDPY